MTTEDKDPLVPLRVHIPRDLRKAVDEFAAQRGMTSDKAVTVLLETG